MPRRFTLKNRSSGLLMHVTSLPGPHGCGDLGPAAYHFVDFLAAAGQSWWQMLPVNPVGPGYSPYSALSAFAGSPLLISLQRLVDDGLLDARELKAGRGLHADRVAYPAVVRFRWALLRRAGARFAAEGGLNNRDFRRFCQDHADWLDDYALYAALRRARRDQGWLTWEPALRLRRGSAVRAATAELRAAIDLERFVQYEFERQWTALRQYAHTASVGLIGDIPIFVAHDSSDVWAHRDLFDLDAKGHAKTVSGVPPDYFSKTGQLWRHPHYRWPQHEATGFKWWLSRFRRVLTQFDAIRIDHFLGFNRVWAVPGRARTAQRGKWVPTPGAKLFTALRKKMGRLEIIAEDLGLVIPEAMALRDRFGFPGMRLLHFAFGNDEGDRYNQPHTYPKNCVVYPGTHDNETTAGWFKRLRAEDQAAHRRKSSAADLTPCARVLRYTGTSGREIHWDLIRLALLSPANTAIVPAQDLLGLDNRARMNAPSTTRGNWQWRLRAGQLTDRVAHRLRELAEAYGRVAEA